MTEKFKGSIDTCNKFGALLTDLSKAFDRRNHTLFSDRLFAFGVSPLSLKLIYSYFSNRTQQIKINKNFSDRTDIEFGVPLSSVLGPLLFNTDLIDLLNAKILMLQVMLMTQHHIHVKHTYLCSFRISIGLKINI